MITQLLKLLIPKVGIQFVEKEDMNFAVDMGGYMIELMAPRIVNNWVIFIADDRRVIDPSVLTEDAQF